MDEKKKLHQINTLENIIINLENNNKYNESNFDNNIQLYGIINYSRTQFFPQLSSYVTGNDEYTDVFFNYTSAESMILDLFMVIESDLVLVLEKTIQYDDNKMTKLITFSLKLLKILYKVMKIKYEILTQQIEKEEYQHLLNEYTNTLFSLQNQFYTLVYDEHIDSRIK